MGELFPHENNGDIWATDKKKRKTKVAGSGLDMFKIVWTPSEATGDNPLTDTLFLHSMEVQTFTADRVLPTLAMSIVSSK